MEITILHEASTQPHRAGRIAHRREIVTTANSICERCRDCNTPIKNSSNASMPRVSIGPILAASSVNNDNGDDVENNIAQRYTIAQRAPNKITVHLFFRVIVIRLLFFQFFHPFFFLFFLLFRPTTLYIFSYVNSCSLRTFFCIGLPRYYQVIAHRSGNRRC